MPAGEVWWRPARLFIQAAVDRGTQFAKKGTTKIVLEGKFQGQKLGRPSTWRWASGDLAARGWGEVAVASLLSLNDPWTEQLVTAYCQEFDIASRTASFLILENDAEYKRLDLENEKVHLFKGELARYVEDVWTQLAKKRSARDEFGRLFLKLDNKKKILTGSASDPVKKLMTLLSEEDCVLPQGRWRGPSCSKKMRTGIIWMPASGTAETCIPTSRRARGVPTMATPTERCGCFQRFWRSTQGVAMLCGWWGIACSI